jgi:hypothetical protein
VSESEHGPEWRADEIGRLYDRIGAIREYRIGLIRELENTGRNGQLQRILDETQAVIDALTDRIEFLIEHGAAWYERDAEGGTAGELRRQLWDYLQAEAETIELWERDHTRRPLPEVEHELTQLHTNFRRDLERLDLLLKEKARGSDPSADGKESASKTAKDVRKE